MNRAALVRYRHSSFTKLITFSFLGFIALSFASVPSVAQEETVLPARKTTMSEKTILRALKQGVPREGLLASLKFIEQYPAKVRNRNRVAIVDFSRSIRQRRLFLVDLKTGAVEKTYVTHGKGSDPERTGWATHFSNQSGTKASSLGFFVTSNAYEGTWGHSLRLKGLSKTNSAVEARNVVFHPYYVGPGNEDLYARHLGEQCVDGGCLTDGCFGIPHGRAAEWIDRLQDGVLVYAFRSKADIAVSPEHLTRN